MDKLEKKASYISASIIMSKVLQDLGMTVVDFANACGVKYGRISDIIRGRTKKISPDLVNEICSAMPQVNKNYLYTGEGEALNNGYFAKTTLESSDIPIINKKVNDLMNLQQELLNLQTKLMEKMEELTKREIAVTKKEFEVRERELKAIDNEAQKRMERTA